MLHQCTSWKRVSMFANTEEEEKNERVLGVLR